MSVCDFQDFHRRDFGPVKTAIGLQRNRIIRWNKDQAIRMVQIHAKLTLAVAGKLVATGWRNNGNQTQVVHRVKLVEPHLQFVGPLPAEVAEHIVFAAAQFQQFSITEKYFHLASLSKRLT